MLKVVELFAGVGGFRIGLEGYNGKSSTSNFKEDIEQNFKVIWSNQWEPLTPTIQSASEIYSKRWPNSNHSNKNINEVIDNTFKEIPEDFDVLVGGFPCQDFSVASTLKNSGGIEGKKGVLWWRIHDILKKVKKKPKFLILENVDRLLKSPSNRRGRDFAIMLGCLRDLGYVVEWRVINAADYGFAQRRRRVFIIAYHKQNKKIIKEIRKNKGLDWVNNNGALAQSFKIKPNKYVKPFILDKDKAAMWRGPMLSGAIKQLKDLTQWGDLDYLFIDMPPGTGDAYLTVASEIKPNHVILVTSQSKLAVQDTIKSKAMFEKLKISMIGVVDNMSHSIYSNFDEQIFEFPSINLENEIGLKVLGSIPRTKDLANFNPNKLSTFFEPVYNDLIKVT